MGNVFVVTSYNIEDSFFSKFVGVFDDYMKAYAAKLQDEAETTGYSCEIISLPINERMTNNYTVVQALPGDFFGKLEE